jgi:hypothetical protein
MQLSLFLWADASPWINVFCLGFQDAWDLPGWKRLGEQQQEAWGLLLAQTRDVLLHVFSAHLTAIEPQLIELKLKFLPKELLLEAITKHMYGTTTAGGIYTQTLAIHIDQHSPLSRAAEVLPEVHGLETLELHGELTRRRNERSRFVRLHDKAYDQKIAAHRLALMKMLDACHSKHIRCPFYVRS